MRSLVSLVVQQKIGMPGNRFHDLVLCHDHDIRTVDLAKLRAFCLQELGLSPDTWEATVLSVTRLADAEDQARGYAALVEAARQFVAKVDGGQARSVRSYAAFKAALELLDGRE